MVENIFIPSYISRKYIQLANHEVSNIPTNCFSACNISNMQNSYKTDAKIAEDCNRDCERLASTIFPFRSGATQAYI